jgi:3'(2'), 5'-bisphosphate nucleotidase
MIDINYINRHLRTAGWHAANMRAGVEIKTKNAADDFVTQADRELDVMISAALGNKLPGCADFSERTDLSDGLISEEQIEDFPAEVVRAVASRQRVWYLDSIDGTDNYVKEDGQYVVLLGLVVDQQPVYGWIYAPARDELYFGGPPSEIAKGFGYVGAWRRQAGATPEPMSRTFPKDPVIAIDYLRVIMGSRDRRDHPDIVERLNAQEWVSVGSLGLKGVAIINGTADVYVHCSQKLKFWDTAAPMALVMAAGLEACDLDGQPLDFMPRAEATGEDIFRHRQAVIIGTPEGVITARQRLNL